MITFENVKFDAQGSSKKDTAGIALKLSGAEDITIKNCEFANMGYSAIKNDATGSVNIIGCKFDCADVYNPIEGSQSVDNGDMLIEGCEFKGQAGNNYANAYQFKNGMKYEIRNCTFEPGVGNNMLRISNRTSAKADFFVKDCAYAYPEGEAYSEYTAFLICQDYTNKSGVKQDFTNCTVSFENVKCNGEMLNAESENVYYVYEDGKGLITGEDNDPKIVFC